MSDVCAGKKENDENWEETMTGLVRSKVDVISRAAAAATCGVNIN